MCFINTGEYQQGDWKCSASTLLELGHSSQGFKFKSLWAQSGIKAKLSVLNLCHTFWIIKKKSLTLKYFFVNPSAMIFFLLTEFSAENSNLIYVSLGHPDLYFSENLVFTGVHSFTTKVWWRSAKGNFFRKWIWICLSWKQCFIICLISISKWANCWCELPQLFVFI